MAAYKAVKQDVGPDFARLAAPDARARLTRALQQTSPSSARGPVTFKPFELLPPLSDTPFKWPTLRHW